MSSMYLHPISTQAFSMEELQHRVEQLLHCRCGACFKCLKRAGLIEH